MDVDALQDIGLLTFESVPNGFDPGWIIFNTQVDIMIIHKVVNALDLEPLRRFGYSKLFQRIINSAEQPA